MEEFAIWASLLLSCCYGTVEMLPGRWRWWPAFVTSGSFLGREMCSGLAASLPDATSLGRMEFLRVKYTLQIHPFGISVHPRGDGSSQSTNGCGIWGSVCSCTQRRAPHLGFFLWGQEEQPMAASAASHGHSWEWENCIRAVWGESWEPAPVVPTYSRIPLGAAQLALVTQTGLKLGIALLQSRCAPCDAALWRQKALCPQSIPSHCSSHLLVPEVLAAAGSIQKGPNSTQLCFAQPLFMQNGCPKAKSLGGREAQHQARRMEEGSETLGMRRRAGMVLLSWRCLKLRAVILTARVLWDQVCGRCCSIFFGAFELVLVLGLVGSVPCPDDLSAGTVLDGYVSLAQTTSGTCCTFAACQALCRGGAEGFGTDVVLGEVGHQGQCSARLSQPWPSHVRAENIRHRELYPWSVPWGTDFFWAQFLLSVGLCPAQPT